MARSAAVRLMRRLGARIRSAAACSLVGPAAARGARRRRAAPEACGRDSGRPAERRCGDGDPPRWNLTRRGRGPSRGAPAPPPELQSLHPWVVRCRAGRAFPPWPRESRRAREAPANGAPSRQPAHRRDAPRVAGSSAAERPAESPAGSRRCAARPMRSGDPHGAGHFTAGFQLANRPAGFSCQAQTCRYHSLRSSPCRSACPRMRGASDSRGRIR